MAEVDLSRRQFFNAITNGIGAVIGAALTIPIAGYFIDPVLRKGTGASGTWVRVASASELGDVPKEFVFQAEKVEGFMKQKVNATVYAFNENGKPAAISNICTHLGCPAKWTESDAKFLCPCHGGVYDKAGTNIGGPPPRPLPRFEAKVENGDLMIMLV